LRTGIAVGNSHRVAVLAVRDQPAVWRVWLDGAPASPAYFIRGSSRGLAAQAMSESWNAGVPVCNDFAFSFDRVSVADTAGGRWRPARGGDPLEDPGYRIVRRHSTGFVAFRYDAGQPVDASISDQAGSNGLVN
jgi:hypothetical protein